MKRKYSFSEFFIDFLVATTAIFNLILTIVFFIGAEEYYLKIKETHGVIGIFFERFWLFSLTALVFVIFLGLLGSLYVWGLKIRDSKWLFKLIKDSIVYQLLCVLLGSLTFAFSYS